MIGLHICLREMEQNEFLLEQSLKNSSTFS